ncbi:MAG: DUF4157 domain-containing protein [Clostridia bacterium]|nr:DUF4157 domain-containing protein [Clostridia bacterium]
MISMYNRNNLSIKPILQLSKTKPMVQPKLTINEPGDIYEQEADAMADRLMRMSSNETVKPVTGLIGKSLQRKCTHCEEKEKTPPPLMRKTENGNSGIQVSSSFATSLNSTKGGGSPLPQGTKSFMENAFSTDFSRIRVHTGGKASEMSKGIQAKAFTHGSDIYFNEGQYNPNSGEGKHLLGHELTHVLQQASSKKSSLQRMFDDHPEMVEKNKPFDESSARAACSSEITSWRTKEFNFASNLLQYFLDKKGPTAYIPNPSDISEVKEHASEKICNEIAEIVPKRTGSLVEIPITIFHGGISDKSSNIRWWNPWGDENMLYAYGGGDLNVKGLATVNGDSWSGVFSVTLGDEYQFDSNSSFKSFFSAYISYAYDAALWLERSNLGYNTFYHTAQFTVTCSSK